MTIEILCIHEVYVTRTMFTLTELLVGPGGTKFETDIRNVKRKTECLFEVLLHV